MNANGLFSSTTSASLPTSQRPVLSFTNSRNTTVNVDKLYDILTRLERLTLPYFDSRGNILQLWKVSPTLVVGAVKDKQQNLMIIPASRIRLLSEKQIDSTQIIHILGRAPLQNWDIAFNPATLEMDLWPNLFAAGKDCYIEVKESPFKNMAKEQMTQHFEQMNSRI